MSEPQQGNYDIVILGGGSGGYACALRAAELGMNVALIERDKLGGTCLHKGCIPTKALLHSAEVADSTRESASFGIEATLSGIDMNGVNSYKDSVVARLYKGLTGLVNGRGITYVEGTGTLTAPNTVTVGNEAYVGRAIVLGTGSYPKSLPGLEIGGRIMTSDQALELDWIPNSVIVLGGGVIGVEFASVWRSFGSEVTIIEALPRLVPAEDPASSKALERAFRKRKIKSVTGARLSGAVADENSVTATLEDGTSHTADVMLVAVGRGPSTSGMGFAEQGVTMDRGWVMTDDHLQTSIPGVYAVGDIVPGLQLAHRGFAQGIFVAEHLAGLNPNPIDEAGIPRVTYCEPEVASVGLNQDVAEEKYGKDAIKTYEYNLGGNGKSQILSTTGFIKLVSLVDGPVVGLHMVGSRMGEQIGEAELIYNWEALPEDVASLLHAHPTQNEALGEAHLALAGKPLHAHG
ncbi:MAG: dihydrolipoyl dehydrogenase [Micrococcales bacterium]|nr:dihydrolipoyl dehydrogenase [Micrococcales bacterium]